jgi:flagellar biosynthesis protein FlhF
MPDPAPRLPATTVRPDPQSARATQQIESELASLKRMMAHMMHAQRAGASGHPGAQAGNRAAGLMPEPLFALFGRMLDNEVSPDIADQIAGEVRDELTADELADELVVRQTVLRRLESRIPTRFERPGEVVSHGLGPRVIALVGPTGVGKTTTVAKLAATFKIRYGLSMGLITADTYRIAAVEQLKTYADIIEVPIEVANTPSEVREAKARLAHADVVLIDSAGRSQRDAARLDELRTILDAASPDETHLVLSAAAAPSTLADIADRFMVLRPDRMILTKLDEAAAPGVLVGLPARVGLPFSYVTTGQEVPDDIEPARAPRLARLVLTDRDAQIGPAQPRPSPGVGGVPPSPKAERANDARRPSSAEEESA